MIQTYRVTRFAALALTGLLAAQAAAGDWQPNPDVKHELVARAEAPAAATPAEDRWVESLLRGLERGGADPKFVHRFARSSAEYRINGERQDGVVFVLRSNPSVFLIASRDETHAEFIVDLASRALYALGVSPIYIPPSGRFCVVAVDYAGPLGGIPVSGPAGDPSFQGRTVSWY